MVTDKVIHGTDGPYAQATQDRMKDYVLELKLRDQEKERILGGNFLLLIG